MKCPICKKIIPDNSLKCPYCKSRTGLICKNCNTINSIFDFKCKNCGTEILKLCPNCSSVNFPNAAKCRKCSYTFKQTQDNDDSENTIKLEYPANLVSQQSAKNILAKGIKKSGKKIFSLSGDKGIGKSLVLKAVIHELKDENYIWLYGKCTPITQITSGGLIQDILLNIFNLPNFCLNNLQFKKDASKFFKNEFQQLNNNEIFDLINFLYPAQDGRFEDIVANKHKTFDFLNKIFDKLTSASKFVIAVDNFDFIDGFSYEFITRFIKKENIWPDFKLLLIYNEPKPAKGYFYFPGEKNDKIYLDVGIAPLEFKQMQSLVDLKTNRIEGFPQLSRAELEEIYKTGRGNPAYITNALDLCFDCQLSGRDFEISTSFEGLLEYRLSILSKLNPSAYDILTASAILGDKININLVKEVFEADDKTFKDILVYLKKMDYIAPVNEIYCEFSSMLLWETVLKTAKHTRNYNTINKKLLNYLNDFTLNSHAIFGIIAQNLKQPELALDIWTKNTKLASYIGDLNLYAISQKQCLALINELDDTETLKIRYNICERLGKLLADFNPKEAMDYLPDAISNAKNMGDSPREIELLGYMSSCCRKTGNYFGEVECTDAVLAKMNPDDKLELALVRSTKLNALLNIGNCGQIINLIDNDIMPAFDDFLSKNEPHPTIPMDIIFETWIKTYLVLANALIIQGNNRSFEILTILFDVLERNRIEDENLICKSQLALAFANTMKGDIPESEKILEEIQKEYQSKSMDNECVTRWNFINIINNFFRKRYNGLQEDLFQIVTFANNNGDNFTKNMLKTMLGIIFRHNDQTSQAMEIYNDQIAYFSKEKMALGALLTWYLIADATIITEGPQQALDIASQALEVAQNPKINNHFFACLLQSVMAKATLALSDFESTKIHLENAIITARQYGLNDLLSRLYLQYGRYFQELGLIKSSRQKDYLAAAAKMYEKASEIIKTTRNNCVHQDIQKAKAVLKTFCHLNKIPIEVKK